MVLIWTITTLFPFVFILQIRRYYVYLLNKVYFVFAAFILQSFCGIKIVIHAKDAQFLEDHETLFVLSNHRTRIDWMFSAWIYTSYLKTYPFLCLILKDELKQVPFFGWCMQVMLYIFLNRKKEKDIPHIESCLDYYAKMNTLITNSVFIFPEGTDLSPSNIEKNKKCKFILKLMQSFIFGNSYYLFDKLYQSIVAREKGLRELKYVLYPKPAGFHACCHNLRISSIENNQPVIIHNLTVAYRDYLPRKRTSELDMIYGKFPREVHLFIDRIPLTSIPCEEEAENQVNIYK
jgi:lysocardiolipin and lysophospholipid acyltransferase